MISTRPHWFAFLSILMIYLVLKDEDDDDEDFMESIKIRDDVLTKGRVNM